MTIPNATEILQHISNQTPDLLRLVTSAMYVLGLYIVITSIAEMRSSALLQSPGQGQKSTWTLMKQVFVGAALVYLPSTIHVALATLFNDTVPYAYPDSSNNPYHNIFEASFLIIQFIGVVAIGKGIYELGYGKGQQTKEGHTGPFAKGIAHIIGGAMCINLQGTIQVVFATLGITGIINF